jgi:hypothetical protein
VSTKAGQVQQLHSSDPQALQTWLAQHGYSIPADVAPIVTAYINDGFDFLAVKLIPNVGVSAMKPIRVTTPGASVQLPLRMVAAGTGASVGITLWVLGDGRWEAQNFPNYTITADELVWDWTTNASNYATLRAQKNTASGGAAWQSESSQDLNTQQLSTAIRFASKGYDPTTGMQRDDYAPSSPAPASDGGADEGGTSADAGAPLDADAAFMADMQALFGNDPVGQIRITRMRSDLPKASLANDLILRAATDQSDLPTVLQVTQESGQPLCPVYNDQCQVIGQAPRDQAQAETDAQRGNNGGGGCAAVKRDVGSLSMEELLVICGVITLGAGARRRWRNRKSNA